LLGSLAIGAAVLAGCPVFPADNHWNLIEGGRSSAGRWRRREG
jgi:hypothetical protein